MISMDLINTFVKIFLISFYIFFTYEKILNYKIKKINYIFIFFISSIIALIYLILTRYILSSITIIILYVLYAFIIKIIINDRINYVAYIFSCIISYIIYLIAVMISGVILFIILKNKKYEASISLIIIPIITIILAMITFRIKRVKNGINFLKNKTIDGNIENLTIFLAGFVVIIFAFSNAKNDMFLGSCILIGTIFMIISLAIWIRTQVTKTYKMKMRDRTIEIQKTEIDEKEKIIEEIKQENIKLATAIHRYNHKFESLEHAMKNALSYDNKTEFANEISIILKETNEAMQNFAKETKVNTTKLPLTNIAGIDNMFKYMQEEAQKNNINFDLKLNASINPLIDNIIQKEKFEILIGDHLKDAIIAINSSKNSYRSILVTLGLIEGVYEFTIYDTGIEFEIDTLIKLGTEQVTTHKNEGGSGIGFMTTFETLKECNASLIIEEYNPETTSYTKSVTIRFDGKNQYKIYSYRAEKIKEQKHKRRIIIERIK